MRKNKKKYLKSYLLQQTKIDRLIKMKAINPNFKEIYEEQIKNANELRNEIEAKILLIDDEILSEVLFQKYILGRTLEEVSLAINYSKRHTERMHTRALDKFEM